MNPNRLKYPILDGESSEDRFKRLKSESTKRLYRKKNPKAFYRIRQTIGAAITKEFIFENSRRDEKTGCLNWSNGKTSAGYGVSTSSGESCYIHRKAYELHNGDIPNGMQVCHHCDNPSCCEPSHLFLGTYKDNMMDCAIKQRKTTQKLNPDEVRKIRSDTRSSVAIATQYGVCKKTILQIRHRRIYAWVA